MRRAATRSRLDAAGVAFALALAYARTAGAAALRRGLPVYAGLVVAVGLLFGGNGLAATTVVAGAAESTVARALLWSGWLVVMTPTLAALWQTRASFYLRSLPVPRSWHLAVLLGMSMLAESLWTALWWLGGGWIAGLGALGGALTGHAIVLARPGGVMGWVTVGGAIAGLVWAPPWLLAIGTWPIGLVIVRAAWLGAPTRAARMGARDVGGPRPLALARALLLAVARGQAAVLLRGALLVGLATAAAWLAARTNRLWAIGDLQVYLCGFLVPAALIAGSAASGPMLQAEQAGAWLLTAARASARTRRGAMALALMGVGAGLGAGAGLVLALAREGEGWNGVSGAVRLAGAGALAGSSLAVVAGLSARWAERFGERGPGRLVLALLLAAIVALVALAWVAALAPAVWAAGAMLVWLMGHLMKETAMIDDGGPGVLEIVGVRKRLGARVVLEVIDLRCGPGQVALLLGENGAGKSTLLRIAAGIVEPDRGSVAIDGRSLAGGDAQARRGLGYAPDTADAFPELSVREFVGLVAALKQAPPPGEGLRDRLGLSAVWDQRMRTLSFGQVKRAYLLAATIGAPRLWLLDEPSNGLDPAGGALVAEMLAEHAAAGGAALVATNDARFVELCAGRRVRLADGRLRDEP